MNTGEDDDLLHLRLKLIEIRKHMLFTLRSVDDWLLLDLRRRTGREPAEDADPLIDVTEPDGSKRLVRRSILGLLSRDARKRKGGGG